MMTMSSYHLVIVAGQPVRLEGPMPAPDPDHVKQPDYDPAQEAERREEEIERREREQSEDFDND